MQTQFSLLDKVIIGLQGAFDTCAAEAKAPSQPNPAAGTAEIKLTTDEQRQSVGLMRVNHAGEVAAQGLYIGQAITARRPELSAQMREAANEEIDHLIW
jgi:ubiquinone biosynthesis monooxygenase Coq7